LMPFFYVPRLEWVILKLFIWNFQIFERKKEKIPGDCRIFLLINEVFKEI